MVSVWCYGVVVIVVMHSRKMHRKLRVSHCFVQYWIDLAIWLKSTCQSDCQWEENESFTVMSFIVHIHEAQNDEASNRCCIQILNWPLLQAEHLDVWIKSRCLLLTTNTIRTIIAIDHTAILYEFFETVFFSHYLKPQSSLHWQRMCWQ